MLAIQPGVAIHVHAVEEDLNAVARRHILHRETLAVPAGAAHHPARVPPALAQVSVERTDPNGRHYVTPDGSGASGFWMRGKVLDAPVMGYVDNAPPAVIKVGPF